MLAWRPNSDKYIGLKSENKGTTGQRKAFSLMRVEEMEKNNTTHHSVGTGGDKRTGRNWFHLLTLNFKICTSRSRRYQKEGLFDWNLFWLSLTWAFKYVWNVGQETRRKNRGEENNLGRSELFLMKTWSNIVLIGLKRSSYQSWGFRISFLQIPSGHDCNLLRKR